MPKRARRDRLESRRTPGRSPPACSPWSPSPPIHLATVDAPLEARSRFAARSRCSTAREPAPPAASVRCGGPRPGESTPGYTRDPRPCSAGRRVLRRLVRTTEPSVDPRRAGSRDVVPNQVPNQLAARSGVPPGRHVSVPVAARGMRAVVLVGTVCPSGRSRRCTSDARGPAPEAASRLWAQSRRSFPGDEIPGCNPQ